MRAILPLILAVLLASCGASETGINRLTCKSSPDLEGVDKIRSTPEWRKSAALLAIKDLREVRELSRRTWFGTGAFSGSLGNIARTEAYSLKSKIRQVESQIADIKAVDFSLEIGGKSPLPSNAEWACRTLVVSVGNLDTGQSDEQFLQMTAMLEDYLTQLCKLNGGVDLESDLATVGYAGAQI